VIGDLDFLVEFEVLDPDSYADTYFGLLEALEQLFGRSVDLVMTSAVTNPYFLQDISRTRIVLYGSLTHGRCCTTFSKPASSCSASSAASPSMIAWPIPCCAPVPSASSRSWAELTHSTPGGGHLLGES
jgi:hypothetical protein